MANVKKVKENIVFDLNKYVNSETGEIVSSELSEGTSVEVKKESGMVTIEYSDYAVIDSDALFYLCSVLNNSDIANVYKMAIVTKTPLNIVFNNNIPHTNETLQKYLSIGSESKFLQLIKRLIKIGVLYQIKGRIYGEVRVCYMLNPHISKKRKVFDEKVVSVFDTLRPEKLL